MGWENPGNKNSPDQGNPGFFLYFYNIINNTYRFMKKFETISSSHWDSQYKKALEAQPLRKELPIKSLQLLHQDTLEINGKPVRMDSTAFKDLCKLVGLPIGFDKTFANTFGDKARQELVNRLKAVAASKGNSNVSIVFSPATKSILSIQKDPKEIFSNQTFLETTSRVIDKYGLEVNSFSVDNDGKIAINTSSPKNEFSIKGLPNEDHFGGVSFLNSPNGGFEVSPFLYRLVCANGMIGRSFEESMKVTSMDPISMNLFWDELSLLAQRNFKPITFDHQVRTAMNTVASVAELHDAHLSLLSYSDATLRETEAWAPYSETIDRYLKSNIDVHLFTPNQRKNAKTGTTIWELVNGITHFATHDNGFKIDDYDRRKLQVEASKLLNKKVYDTANLVASPF